MNYMKAEKLHRKLGHIGRELARERHEMHERHGKHGPERMRTDGPFDRRRGPFEPHGPRMYPRERILMILSDAEGGLHQKDIAGSMHINPSSLSEAIDKLESDGYVRRDIDPADRRATLISLTEKGQARAAEVGDMHKERMQKLFANLTEEEQDQLFALLDKAFPDRKE